MTDYEAMAAEVQRYGNSMAEGRLNDDPPNREDWLPLELCTGLTPECPHYACPDGWHAGEAPNCSCTPDCALTEDDDE